MPVTVANPDSSIVVEGNDGVINVIQSGVVQYITIASQQVIAVAAPQNAISVQVAKVIAVNSGLPGPQGPPGSGGGSSGSAIAGATITSGIAVVIIDDLMYPADPTNSAHGVAVVGIATQSGIAGTSLNYTGAGVVSGLGSYTPNANYFVGLSGALTTNPVVPGQLWSKLVGVGQTGSDLLVNMETTFYG